MLSGPNLSQWLKSSALCLSLPSLNITAFSCLPQTVVFQSYATEPKPSTAPSHLQEGPNLSLAFKGPEQPLPGNLLPWDLPWHALIFMFHPTPEIFFIMFSALISHSPLSHLGLHHPPNLEGTFSSLTLLLAPRPRSALPKGLHWRDEFVLIFLLCILCPISSISLYNCLQGRDPIHIHLEPQHVPGRVGAQKTVLNLAAADGPNEIVNEEKNSKSHRQAPNS